MGETVTLCKRCGKKWSFGAFAVLGRCLLREDSLIPPKTLEIEVKSVYYKTCCKQERFSELHMANPGQL